MAGDAKRCARMVLITIEAEQGIRNSETLQDAGIGQVDINWPESYDLVAVIDANGSQEDLGEIVIGTIQKNPGVVSTVTLLAIG